MRKIIFTIILFSYVFSAPAFGVLGPMKSRELTQVYCVYNDASLVAKTHTLRISADMGLPKQVEWLRKADLAPTEFESGHGLKSFSRAIRVSFEDAAKLKEACRSALEGIKKDAKLVEVRGQVSRSLSAFFKVGMGALGAFLGLSREGFPILTEWRKGMHIRVLSDFANYSADRQLSSLSAAFSQMDKNFDREGFEFPFFAAVSAKRKAEAIEREAIRKKALEDKRNSQPKIRLAFDKFGGSAKELGSRAIRISLEKAIDDGANKAGALAKYYFVRWLYENGNLELRSALDNSVVTGVYVANKRPLPLVQLVRSLTGLDLEQLLPAPFGFLRVKMEKMFAAFFTDAARDYLEAYIAYTAKEHFRRLFYLESEDPQSLRADDNELQAKLEQWLSVAPAGIREKHVQAGADPELIEGGLRGYLRAKEGALERYVDSSCSLEDVWPYYKALFFESLFIKVSELVAKSVEVQSRILVHEFVAAHSKSSLSWATLVSLAGMAGTIGVVPGLIGAASFGVAKVLCFDGLCVKVADYSSKKVSETLKSMVDGTHVVPVHLRPSTLDDLSPLARPPHKLATISNVISGACR